MLSIYLFVSYSSDIIKLKQIYPIHYTLYLDTIYYIHIHVYILSTIAPILYATLYILHTIYQIYQLSIK